MSNDKMKETQEPSLEEELEEAKRFYALKEWTQAVDAYAEVLETLRGMHSEEEALFAPVFHRYGHSLLEYAISKSGALGGGGTSSDGFLPQGKTGKSEVGRGPEKASAQASSSSGAASSSKGQEKPAHDPRFTFGGDAEESEEEEEEEQGAKGGEQEEEEDDLGIAFSILEIARVMYEKVLEDGESASLKTIEGEEWSSVMVKSQLAEVLNDLADVGLESENFQQASTDYKTSLDLLSPLLQPHSRRLADAYLRLGLALEFHPDATLQSSAGKYVTGACTTLEKRMDSLMARQRVLQKEAETGQAGLARAGAAASDIRAEKAETESRERLREEGVLPPSDSSTEMNSTFEKDDVARMDLDQVEKEKKDVQEMIEELKQKLDDYAAAAVGSNANAANSSSSAPLSAKEKVQAAINEVLLGSSTNALGAPPPLNPDAPVNDLSAMVKKKKPVVVEEAAAAAPADQQGKRKERDVVEIEQDANGKKLKAE